ncbi:MAG: NAD(P)H-dependent oxidoreductase [Bacteroidales bacterium]|jgi:chromate reductase|nr:NAD(P)H-dependent oxidoreductase [Bacteroidales bacterium]
MKKNIKIAGFCGSLRKESFNNKILALAGELLPDNMELIQITFDTVPLYNEDIDTATPPVAVAALREALASVDGILIVSPEYNHAMPGGLKNALDWASRGANNPLAGKPVSLIGATLGMWGTARMQASFLTFFHLMNMPVVARPEVLINLVSTKFDENGNFTDETTKKLMRQNLENLQSLILAK